MIKVLVMALLSLLAIISVGCYAGTPRVLDSLRVDNASLAWEYPADLLPTIDHFNVFWSPDADLEQATEINAGKLLTWTIPNMNCVDCRFWVSAVDLNDVESERVLGVDSDGNDW